MDWGSRGCGGVLHLQDESWMVMVRVGGYDSQRACSGCGLVFGLCGNCGMGIM